jgi:hypothetical protein
MNDPTVFPDSRSAATTRRLRLTEVGSVAAVLISLLALGLGVYQTSVMQAQARASVWPYVAISRSYYDSGESQGFTWEIANHGVGPAKVESVVNEVDGKTVTTWDALLVPLLGKTRTVISNATYSTLGRFVLPPDSNRDTALPVLHLMDPDDARTMDAAAHRLDMAVCYCSVYRQCWLAHSINEPVEVTRCDSARALQFKY